MKNTEIIRKKVSERFSNCSNRYHNFEHTKEFVEAAERICEEEGVSNEEKSTVVLAGWLHDVGAVEGYKGHVKRSMAVADSILSELDFSNDKIEKVKSLIRATDPEREPENVLEEIMQDADSSYKAREDFMQRLEDMWNEFREMGLTRESRREFMENSVEHLEKSYHTEGARKLYGRKRSENLETLKQSLQ